MFEFMEEYSDEFLEGTVAEAECRYRAALRECQLAGGAYRHAMSQAAWSFCVHHNLTPGKNTLVKVAFSDGTRTALFEELDWSSDSPVVLRMLTVKGKPCKSVERYEWCVVKLMKRVQAEQAATSGDPAP